MSASAAILTGTFLYFAYGSNMLTSRLHIANPSAVFENIGKVKDYRLDFIGSSKVWGGAPATIVPTWNSAVWGVIYVMSNENIASLDRQEGVHLGIYSVLNVTVTSHEGKIYHCRSYKQTRDPEKNVPLSQLPKDRQPSLSYLNTIINGAKEHAIPRYYVKRLMAIKNNDYNEKINPTDLEAPDEVSK